VATIGDIRKIALALDGVSEVDHWGRPAFRTKRRMFVIVRTKEKVANIILPEERKEFLYEAAPDIFTKHWWGKMSYMLADLTKIEKRELEGLVREAWAHAAPAKPRKRATTKPPRRGAAPRR
jgi:hypothetical protein